MNGNEALLNQSQITGKRTLKVVNRYRISTLRRTQYRTNKGS
jgi:hypothetical protein